MIQKVLQKIILIGSALAGLFLFIDGCLFTSLQVKESFGKVEESIVYETITYFPNRVYDIDLKNEFSPIIIFPIVEFETPQNSLWIEVASSRALEVSDQFIFELSKNDELFTYYNLRIDREYEIESDFKLTFQASNGSIINKNVSVTWLEQEVLGAWDIRDDEIIPDGDDLLTVVDKEFALPYNFVPRDLVNISEYDIPCKSDSAQLRSIVIDDLKDLFEDVQNGDIDILVYSAYRSYEDQLAIYKSRVFRDGASFADSMTARPGHSEHQLGTTIDFTSLEVLSGKVRFFSNTIAASWLSENAYKYGFVMSYPAGSEEITGYKYEAWHYRYIGKEAAREIYESDKIPLTYLREENSP
jgi:D-alanyl-D-alanine carboxypeptidase